MPGWPGEKTVVAPAKKILAPPVPMRRPANHRNQGRQGAVDKKRGQNPVKETASIPANRPGTVYTKLPSKDHEYSCHSERS